MSTPTSHSEPRATTPDQTSRADDPLDALRNRFSLPSVTVRDRRIARVKELIDERVVHWCPESLGFIGTVLDWPEVEKMLPRKDKSGTGWQHRVRPEKISDLRVYCVTGHIMAVSATQNLMNYRNDSIRLLPSTPTPDRPVSTGLPVADRGTQTLTLRHDYLGAAALIDAFNAAGTELREERRRNHSWEPLHNTVCRDGVEQPGYWIPAVYVDLTNGNAARSALTALDGSSRSEVCSGVQDPEMKLRGFPLFQPLGADIFDHPSRPQAPLSIEHAATSLLAKAQKAVEGIERLDDLDDDLRARVQTFAIPVRIVYAVEDPRGNEVRISGPELLRRLQEHEHGGAHADHSKSATGLMVAARVLAAMHEAVDDGLFTVVDRNEEGAGTNSDGDVVDLAWTHDLLDVFGPDGDLTALSTLGLPSDSTGRAAAALILTCAGGPTRRIVGKALGSKRGPKNTFGDPLAKEREKLLRELVFYEHPATDRICNRLPIKGAFEGHHITWDGDIDALTDAVIDNNADDWEQCLLYILACIRATEMGMAMVDVGSQGEARGYMTTKVAKALNGCLIKTDDGEVLYKPKHGPMYVRALLNGSLRVDDPDPGLVPTRDGNRTPVDYPTDAQWQEWQSGVGALDPDGDPFMRDVAATVTDAGGFLATESDGRIQTVVLQVPEPVSRKVFDEFTVRNMTAGWKKQVEAGHVVGLPEPRPQQPTERASAALLLGARAVTDLAEAARTLLLLSEDGWFATPEQHLALITLNDGTRGVFDPGGALDLLQRAASNQHRALASHSPDAATLVEDDAADGDEVETDV